MHLFLSDYRLQHVCVRTASREVWSLGTPDLVLVHAGGLQDRSCCQSDQMREIWREAGDQVCDRVREVGLVDKADVETWLTEPMSNMNLDKTTLVDFAERLRLQCEWLVLKYCESRPVVH